MPVIVPAAVLPTNLFRMARMTSMMLSIIASFQGRDNDLVRPSVRAAIVCVPVPVVVHAYLGTVS